MIQDSVQFSCSVVSDSSRPRESQHARPPTGLVIEKQFFLLGSGHINRLCSERCSVAQSCPTLRPHGLQHARLPCPSLSPGVCSLMSIESVMPSNHLVLCRPLLLLPSIIPNTRVSSNESVPHNGIYRICCCSFHQGREVLSGESGSR